MFHSYVNVLSFNGLVYVKIHRTKVTKAIFTGKNHGFKRCPDFPGDLYHTPPSKKPPSNDQRGHEFLGKAGPGALSWSRAQSDQQLGGFAAGALDEGKSHQRFIMDVCHGYIFMVYIWGFP